MNPAYIPGGSKWGSLTLVRRLRTSYESPDGSFYDSHGGPIMWTLHCECGHDFTIEQDAFPGKRVMRSCGREGCPYSTVAAGKGSGPHGERTGVGSQKALGRPRLPEPHKVLTCYLSVHVIDGIRNYARSRDICVSRATDELVDFGLAYRKLQEES